MGSEPLQLLLTTAQTAGQPVARVGGKALALARMAEAGFAVPHALCLPVSAYRQYLRETDLAQQLTMELGRKDFADMRWEELWDTALRIRHLFLDTPLPGSLAETLSSDIETAFGDNSLAVRSSAPEEDSAGASFAGLHSSEVNVRGADAVCRAVRKVWASLWSDRALLYRRELGLDVKRSAMAVLIQQLVDGEKSGVAFSRSPDQPQQLLIEAVWGLNQGLVDGTIEPDHWQLERHTSRLLSHRAARRQQAVRPVAGGVQTMTLDADQAQRPPLSGDELAQVATLAIKLEELHGRPQDVEWTFSGERLLLLQTRSVTARREAAAGDQRGWYLSLHRSVANLQQLRRRIEEEVIPGMERAAAELAAVDPTGLHDAALAAEIQQRRQLLAEWREVYRRECIPMAHGVRLFGEFYNDQLLPSDPFAFTRLLQGAGMGAVRRNRELMELAAEVRRRADWQQALEAGAELPAQLAALLLPVTESLGLPSAQAGRLLLELARQPRPQGPAAGSADLEADYLTRFDAENKAWAAQLLDLGRASYRLRDDDNLSLDKLQRQLERVEEEGRRRLAQQPSAPLAELLEEPPASGRARSPKVPRGRLRVRQVQGQPAGPGLASALARVVADPRDLADFRAGEILVCDAIDPAMTFVVPLAAGIVERRGGMLIHGAIIAREYGLPCVTGIPDAVDIIRTGDRLTVDGYLGLVIIDGRKAG